MNVVFAQPVGCGLSQSKRASRPPFRPVAAYAAACTAGGTLTGAVLGLIGVAARLSPRPAAIGVASLLVAVATWASLRGRVAPLPERAAQVPQHWLLAWRPERAAAGFGVMIGCGALTLLHHASAYTGAVVVVLAPTPLAAVGLGAFYGAVRGGMLVAAWCLRAGTAASPRGRTFARLGTLGAALTVLSVVTFVSVAAQEL